MALQFKDQAFVDLGVFKFLASGFKFVKQEEDDYTFCQDFRHIQFVVNRSVCLSVFPIPLPCHPNSMRSDMWLP